MDREAYRELVRETTREVIKSAVTGEAAGDGASQESPAPKGEEPEDEYPFVPPECADGFTEEDIY
jgi:hypothetical protein